jgi:ElaB/YqjD/DUF883 family membrane-anchored ribosome-binding protein
MAAGCSGDCVGDYLSRHELNNRARHCGIPAAGGLARNPDPSTRNVNRKRKMIMEMSENFTTHTSNPGGGNSSSAGAADTAHKVVDAASSTMDRMASGAHAAVDKTADMAARAAETLDVKGEQLKDLQARWLENSRAYIRDNPVKAVGIAIVGGFLLSRLLSSR